MAEVKIKITGNILLTDELDAFIKKKLKKLEKRINRDETTALFEIELKELQKKTDTAYRVEINFSSNGKVLRAEAESGALHPTIDRAVNEAAERISHLKAKHSDLAKKTGAKIKGFLKNVGL